MKLEVVNSGPSTGPTIGVFPTGDVSSPLVIKIKSFHQLLDLIKLVIDL